MNVSLAKAQLRKQVAERLKLLDAESRKAQSDCITAKVLSNSRYQEAKRISLYLSTWTEVETRGILTDTFQSGKTCFIPRFSNKQDKMDMVKLQSLQDYDKLPTVKWNIKQPPLEQFRENALETGGLDLIILPGVAFTKDGRRLGHGKGFYDKYLSRYRSVLGSTPYLIALAFKEQIFDNIPTTETDVLLDEVITA